MSGVTESFANGVLTLSLDRPDKRNAIDAAMLDGLAAGLARAELDADVRAVVLRGAGRDFCAGADLDELLASADKSLEENERSALALGEIFLALRQVPKPTVAVVHGRALAGGAGLAMASDVVLATESSRFGFPEIERGFVPAMVMTMLRRSVGEKHAFELVSTGRVLSAHEAREIGLVSRVFAAKEFDPLSKALLDKLAAAPPSAMAATKTLFYKLDTLGFLDGISAGIVANADARATPAFRDGVKRFTSRKRE